MNRQVHRELFRDRWYVALALVAPFALLLQLVGDRPAFETAVSCLAIVAVSAMVTRHGYQRAAERLEDRAAARIPARLAK